MAVNETKLQVSTSGQTFVTIPQSIAAFKGWKKGTPLRIVSNADGDLVIQEIR